jgi:hypothetical protein
MCWSGVASASFDGTALALCSGGESRFRGRLMYVDLLGGRSWQDVPGLLDFTPGDAVSNQQKTSRP